MTRLYAWFGGRKVFWGAFIGTAIAIVLGVVKDAGYEQIMFYVVAMLGASVLGIAIEDGVRKIRNGGDPGA